MDNKKTTVDLTQETPLKDKVTELKLVARDSLRMELISNRLTKIADLKSQMKYSDEHTDRLNKELKTHEYELETLDSKHPKYEDRKEHHKYEIEFFKETLEKEEKEKATIQEKLDKELEGVILIETGKTKVSLEHLNEYVSELIREQAKNRVNQ